MASPSGEPGGRPGAIYVVATPIGNLEDITLRAVRVLREADLVAAEDTRRARLLLEHLGIAKRVVAYFDAVEATRAPDLVRRALAGESIALISDAGTPLVADPGYRLVRAAIEAGVPVVPVPGASALLALLACAGLPPARFTFAGFLPARRSARRRELADLAGRDDTLLFYESPRRLAAALADMAEVLGDRPCAVGRELTKRFEEVVRGALVDVAARFAARAEGEGLRGEMVVAVGGASGSRPRMAHGADGADPAVSGEPGESDEAPRVAAAGDAAMRAATLLRARLAAGESVAAAAKAVAAATGLSRRDMYRCALEIRAASPPQRD